MSMEEVVGLANLSHTQYNRNLQYFFFFLRFYVEASELFHVASGLENILKQTAQSNCHHCLKLMKIG